MNILREVFFKSEDSNTTPIKDYFKIQSILLKLIGVWPPLSTANVNVRVLYRVIKSLQQIFNVLLILHIAVMYSWTLYFEIETGSFASISFALSQLIILIFATFSLVYMTIKTQTIICMIEHINCHFKIRSAKGKINVVLKVWRDKYVLLIIGLTFMTSRNSYNFSWFVTSFYTFAAVVSLLQWAVIAFFTKEKDLPLNAWYPFDKFVSLIKIYL